MDDVYALIQGSKLSTMGRTKRTVPDKQALQVRRRQGSGCVGSVENQMKSCEIRHDDYQEVTDRGILTDGHTAPMACLRHLLAAEAI